MQIYFILDSLQLLHVILHPLSLPAWPLFERWNSVIVHPSNIILAPKPRIYYQNICTLPRKIPMNIQITYFCAWNSLKFCLFQLSTILVDYLQTNHFLENTDFRVQARGRLRRNTRPDGVNFALEGSGGKKTLPDICSFCKMLLLVLPVMLKTKCKIFVTNGHEIFR